ncbi:lebercilin isoform X3 [Culex quinquefasciatus]|uniref:lebercilin isoform X3 n=1 Tax=Culex quinquefasciatus TaxID=7176 RepID=UPI0018E3042E|nr:lebercilin isoform X3 [Culex quinquefasciatus]
MSSSMRSSISMRSMESLYSNKSSNFSALHRRKAIAARQPAIVISSNDVRHRVMSARVLRFKQLQNQLEAAHQTIAELTKDNRLLRALQKRQDSALSKYENSNAELPKLLHSHAEEIRTHQMKARNLLNQNKELINKLKQKDAHILTITDQNKHLIQLNKDKHLEERERLAERVRDLETRLIEKDNDTKLLARRLQLETKNFKAQLQQEVLKQREIAQKLERAHHEIQRLNSVIEIYEKRTPSTLLKNSNYLMKPSKPTSGQLARLPNGSPVRPAFPLQNLAEPAPVTNMEIAPKRIPDEGGDGDHKLPSPKTLEPLNSSMVDPTPAVTPAKSSKIKKRHNTVRVHEEKNLNGTDKDPNQQHQFDESFCKDFNQYALQQEAEFDQAIESELFKLKKDIPFSNGSTTDSLLQRRNKKLYQTTEVSYEDDYEPDSSPEKGRAKITEIYDHKAHISELEEQIRNMGGPLMNGSLGKDTKLKARKASASSGDTDQESNSSTTVSRDSSSKEFESMKREIRESILKKESLLDSFCDEINGKDSHKSLSMRTKESQKRIQIDPKKKKNLLEALKAIDGEGVEK